MGSTLFPTYHAFRNCTLLDGTRKMRPQEHMSVIWCEDSGTIDAVLPDEDAQYPTGMGVWDLGGRFVTPGLVNLHAHLAGGGKPASSGDNAALVAKISQVPMSDRIGSMLMDGNLREAVQAGVTCVRSAGDPLWGDIRLRDRLDKKGSAPKLVAAGWGITPTRGHGAGLVAREAETVDDARRQVREIVEHGADVVKLFITGGVYDADAPDTPGRVLMSQEMADAIVEETHQLGLPTMAHVESSDGVRRALLAGVDSIEHGAPLDDEMLRLFKKNGAGRASTLTCTLSPAVPFCTMPAEKTHSEPAVKACADQVFDGMVECARQALRAGVTVGLGTDAGCPYISHGDLWRELVYFDALVAHDPALTLHTATLGNARIIGLEEKLGSIAPGKQADMIVLEKNPLEDLSALRAPFHVVARGRIIEHPRPKRDPALQADLDAAMAQVLAKAEVRGTLVP